MKFDELLAIIDDTMLDVYVSTECDPHLTIWEGHDYDFTYEKACESPVVADKAELMDAEVVRVQSAGDWLCVGLPWYNFEASGEKH